MAGQEKAVETVVIEERKRDRREKQKLEDSKAPSAALRRRSKILNEIAYRELQIGGPGKGLGSGTVNDPRPPLNGFEFVPDTYKVVVSERESLKLRVQVDGTTGLAVGDKIEISCDIPNFRILDNSPVVPKLFHDEPPLSRVDVLVEGLQANSQGFITAKCNGKIAMAAIEVVSTRAQKQQPPAGGLFKEIKFEADETLPRRSRFRGNYLDKHARALGGPLFWSWWRRPREASK